jgi:predicted RNA methylase
MTEVGGIPPSRSLVVLVRTRAGEIEGEALDLFAAAGVIDLVAKLLGSKSLRQ